jgi:hypothetical protein
LEAPVTEAGNSPNQSGLAGRDVPRLDSNMVERETHVELP